MRLTKNNIAYVNETVLENGKLSFAVVMKSRAMSDNKFYNVETVNELPKTIQSFISTANCECIEYNDKYNFTRYQYR